MIFIHHHAKWTRKGSLAMIKVVRFDTVVYGVDLGENLQQRFVIHRDMVLEFGLERSTRRRRQLELITELHIWCVVIWLSWISLMNILLLVGVLQLLVLPHLLQLQGFEGKWLNWNVLMIRCLRSYLGMRRKGRRSEIYLITFKIMKCLRVKEWSMVINLANLGDLCLSIIVCCNFPNCWSI